MTNADPLDAQNAAGFSDLASRWDGAVGSARRRVPWWAWAALAAVLVGGGWVRFTIRADYLAHNPLALQPSVDARTYWDWAGRIAAGKWSDGQPFFSAPLYPYLLGWLRAAGGELSHVYAAQIFMDLLAAFLLAWVGFRRSGIPVGLAAATVFLFTLEPASYCLRVLAGSLQVLLVCVAWVALLRAGERFTWLRVALAGAALGLLSLAFAPALLTLPLFALWLWARNGANAGAMVRALTGVAAGVLVIMPATIHNYRATGEFIPISAQAGVTFLHGNGPGAKGIYARASDVSIHRESQNLDAERIYREQTGEEPTWGKVNRYFFRRGLDYLRRNPGDAAVLLARKAYWFLTGRNYGDICRPTMEIAEGLTSRLRWCPVYTAWLIPPALVALAVWSRRWRTWGPELLLFGVPLLVVVIFWYSPRYRLPATPVIVLAAVWTLGQAMRWRHRRMLAMAAVLSVAVAGGLDVLNRRIGFDVVEPDRPMFYNAIGVALANAGRLDQAAEYYRRALELRPDYPEARAHLGDVLARTGRPADALALLRQAVAARPHDALAHDALGRALTAAGEIDEAVACFREAVRLNPKSPQLRVNLGNALLLKKNVDGAVAQYRAALDIDPGCSLAEHDLALALARGGRHREALRHYEKVLKREPGSVRVMLEMLESQRACGDAAGFVSTLRALHAAAPKDRAIANNLAWYLATLPNLDERRRQEALAIAERNVAGQADPPADRLDTLAAAAAATGDFRRAAALARRAIDAARRDGDEPSARVFRERLERYRAGRPWIEPLRPSAEREDRPRRRFPRGMKSQGNGSWGAGRAGCAFAPSGGIAWLTAGVAGE